MGLAPGLKLKILPLYQTLIQPVTMQKVLGIAVARVAQSVMDTLNAQTTTPNSVPLLPYDIYDVDTTGFNIDSEGKKPFWFPLYEIVVAGPIQRTKIEGYSSRS
jgi:hypothetical protein